MDDQVSSSTNALINLRQENERKCQKIEIWLHLKIKIENKFTKIKIKSMNLKFKLEIWKFGMHVPLCHVAWRDFHWLGDYILIIDITK